MSAKNVTLPQVDSALDSRKEKLPRVSAWTRTHKQQVAVQTITKEFPKKTEQITLDTEISSLQYSWTPTHSWTAASTFATPAHGDWLSHGRIKSCGSPLRPHPHRRLRLYEESSDNHATSGMYDETVVGCREGGGR